MKFEVLASENRVAAATSRIRKKEANRLFTRGRQLRSEGHRVWGDASNRCGCLLVTRALLRDSPYESERELEAREGPLRAKTLEAEVEGGRRLVAQGEARRDHAQRLVMKYKARLQALRLGLLG